MRLKFHEVEVPAVAAGVLGLDGYQASMPVRHGCGHEDRCAIILSKHQMAELGIALLERRAPWPAALVRQMEEQLARIAEHRRCRRCLEREADDRVYYDPCQVCCPFGAGACVGHVRSGEEEIEDGCSL